MEVCGAGYIGFNLNCIMCVYLDEKKNITDAGKQRNYIFGGLIALDHYLVNWNQLVIRSFIEYGLGY